MASPCRYVLQGENNFCIGAGAGGDWLLGGLEVRSSAVGQRTSFACGRCLPGDGSLTELLPGAVLLAPNLVLPVNSRPERCHTSSSASCLSGCEQLLTASLSMCMEVAEQLLHA